MIVFEVKVFVIEDQLVFVMFFLKLFVWFMCVQDIYDVWEGCLDVDILKDFIVIKE